MATVSDSLLMEWFNLYCMVIFVDGLVPLSNIGGTGYVDDIEMGTLLYPLPDILVNRACVSFLQVCLDTVLACVD